ncbi:hypothetical protein V6N11_053580 [Hibiscus sabdariffa]|uniref:Uncharacterized protein n=1 Tax=Hibiscus sabdariffa TaxID=183260 RepID=A0ABR2UDR4_9ROSI
MNLRSGLELRGGESESNLVQIFDVHFGENSFNPSQFGFDKAAMTTPQSKLEVDGEGSNGGCKGQKLLNMFSLGRFRRLRNGRIRQVAYHKWWD